MPGQRRGLGVGNAAAAILFQVPAGMADLGQEPGDPRLVGGAVVVGEHPPVQMPRVPLDQHVADVEDHRVDHGGVDLSHHPSLPDRSPVPGPRSEEHTSELQSLKRISYAVFCLKKKNITHTQTHTEPYSTYHTT